MCVVGGLKLGLVGGSRIGNQWTQTEVVAPAKERRFGGGWLWVVWYLDRISNYWQILMDTQILRKKNQKLNQQMRWGLKLKIFETAGPLF